MQTGHDINKFWLLWSCVAAVFSNIFVVCTVAFFSYMKTFLVTATFFSSAFVLLVDKLSQLLVGAPVHDPTPCHSGDCHRQTTRLWKHIFAWKVLHPFKLPSRAACGDGPVNTEVIIFQCSITDSAVSLHTWFSHSWPYLIKLVKKCIVDFVVHMYCIFNPAPQFKYSRVVEL